ncbi:hypothetical protein CEUSTIGMA_g12552.t1 [Chlamydomonas eustigma]|uniref:Protein kinase domain-containing protein n=1 Tax=Chlamydomonas eustigma TaxID=1157962 RepID=A0A250XQB8_9CHLO|nr:hypothetical protein CEUSTIGMA_g12552.t1 [Chlamydomonas eustigma]|eukprot:GAX85132.1 hypothetical protein CEUSTIGMA_g12552.t1 [Chlamydomonas eustigma]
MTFLTIQAPVGNTHHDLHLSNVTSLRGVPKSSYKLRCSTLASSRLQAPPTLDTKCKLGWKEDLKTSFTLGPLIGASAFGKVFMGTDKASGNAVAVKTMPKIRVGLTQSQTQDRIQKEIEVLQVLQSCPGVIKLLDCFEDERQVQIVTELCPGGDLQQYVHSKGALQEKQLAAIANEVLKTVKQCHDSGVLHGDVKPGNFCFKECEFSATSLRAIDFGCSQYLSNKKKRFTKRTGTPAFMSPEIYAKDYGQKADIWSAGVMLYWLFSMRLPFFKSEDAAKATHSLDDMEAAVGGAEISYSFGPWRRISPEGLDFIMNCLQRCEMDRFGVDEALSHPWLALNP